MMMTYGCDWDVAIDNDTLTGERMLAISAPRLQAGLGLNWLPLRPSNDNLPEFLDVAK